MLNRTIVSSLLTMIGPVKKPLNLLFRAPSPKLKMAFNHLSEIFYFSISVALLLLLFIAYLHGDVLFWWWCCCLFVFFFEVGGKGWLIQDGNYNATATMWKASCNLLGKISNFIRSLNDLKILTTSACNSLTKLRHFFLKRYPVVSYAWTFRTQTIRTQA